jgi:hypothetical protein
MLDGWEILFEMGLSTGAMVKQKMRFERLRNLVRDGMGIAERGRINGSSCCVELGDDNS